VDVEPLHGSVAINNLVVLEDGERKLLDGVSAEFGLDEHVGVIGPDSGAKGALAMTLARLAKPTSGSIRLGGRILQDLAEAAPGRRTSYIGQDAYLSPLSVRDNILYGLRHRPEHQRDYDDEVRRNLEREMAEARRAGNPVLDLDADWTDYDAAGATGPSDIDDRIIGVLRAVEFEEDVYHFGLRGTIKPEERPDLAASIIAAREELHGRLEQPDLASLVEPFDPHHYNRNMSIFENLLFGTATGDEEAMDVLNAYIRQVLESQGLADDLVKIGIDIARTMIELFADLPPGHPFFEQFSFIASDALPSYQALVARVDKEGLAKLSDKERKSFLALAFPYIEARHRLGQIDAAMEERLLAARRSLAEQLP